MGCLLGPVVRGWPDCVAKVRALGNSQDLRELARRFTESRGGFTGRPAEFLESVLGPPESHRSKRLAQVQRPRQQSGPPSKRARH